MMTFLSSRETDNFYRYLTFFFTYLIFFLIIYALTTYLQSFLAITFRKELTSQFFNLYLKENNYYHLNFKNEIDNPDQQVHLLDRQKFVPYGYPQLEILFY